MPPLALPVRSARITASPFAAANAENPSILPIEDIEEAVWTYMQTTRTPKTKLDFAAQRIGAFKPVSSWKRRVLRLVVKDGHCTMTVAEDEDSLKTSATFELARVVDLRWVFIPEDESLAFGVTAQSSSEDNALLTKTQKGKRKKLRKIGGGKDFFEDGNADDEDDDNGLTAENIGFSTAMPNYQYVYGQIAFSVLILNPKYLKAYDACGDDKEKVDALLSKSEACTVVSFAFGSTAEAESWYEWFSELILLRERAIVETKDSDGGYGYGSVFSTGHGLIAHVATATNTFITAGDGVAGGEKSGSEALSPNAISALRLLPAVPTYRLAPTNIRALKDYVHFFLKSGPKGGGGGGGVGGAAARFLWGSEGPPNDGRLRCKAPNSSDYHSVFLNGNYSTGEIYFAKGHKSAFMRFIKGGVKYTRRLVLNANCRIMATSAFGTELVVDMTPLPNSLVYSNNTNDNSNDADAGGAFEYSSRFGGSSMWGDDDDDDEEYDDEDDDDDGFEGDGREGDGAHEGKPNAAAPKADDGVNTTKLELPPLAGSTADQYAQRIARPASPSRRGGGGRRRRSDASSSSASRYGGGGGGGGASSLGRRSSSATTTIITTNNRSTVIGGGGGGGGFNNQPQLRLSRNTWSFLCKSVKIRNGFIEWMRLIKGKGGLKAQTDEETYPFTISTRDDIEYAYSVAAAEALNAGGNNINSHNKGGGGRDRRFGASGFLDDGTATNYSFGDGANTATTTTNGSDDERSGGGAGNNGNNNNSNNRKRVGFSNTVVATDAEEERRRREEEDYLALFPSHEPSSCSSSACGGSEGSGGREFRYFPSYNELTVLAYIDSQAAEHLVGRPTPVLKRLFPPGHIPPHLLLVGSGGGGNGNGPMGLSSSSMAAATSFGRSFGGSGGGVVGGSSPSSSHLYNYNNSCSSFGVGGGQLSKQQLLALTPLGRLKLQQQQQLERGGGFNYNINSSGVGGGGVGSQPLTPRSAAGGGGGGGGRAFPASASSSAAPAAGFFSSPMPLRFGNGSHHQQHHSSDEGWGPPHAPRSGVVAAASPHHLGYAAVADYRHGLDEHGGAAGGVYSQLQQHRRGGGGSRSNSSTHIGGGGGVGGNGAQKKINHHNNRGTATTSPFVGAHHHARARTPPIASSQSPRGTVRGGGGWGGRLHHDDDDERAAATGSGAGVGSSTSSPSSATTTNAMPRSTYNADAFLKNLPTARSGVATVMSSRSPPRIGGGGGGGGGGAGSAVASAAAAAPKGWGGGRPPPPPLSNSFMPSASTATTPTRSWSAGGGRSRSDALLKSQTPVKTAKRMLL